MTVGVDADIKRNPRRWMQLTVIHMITLPTTPRARHVWHHLGVTSAPPVHTDAEYLDNLTRKIFISGFSGDPVATRWPRFREVFYAFDPGMVAEMPGLLIDHLQQDPGIIRNKRKLRATVANASEFVRIGEEFGSFHDYLRSLDDLPYEQRAREIGKRFASVGPNTVYYFLEDAGEPVPPVKPEGVKSKKKRLAKRSHERAR
jgi:DNA-3-methyladenine glycosylase I